MDVSCKFSKFSRITGSFFLFLFLFCISLNSQALSLAGATYTWTGANILLNNDWRAAGNWDLPLYPNAGNTVIFPQIAQNYAVTNANPITIGSMIFQGQYTFTNNDNFILSSSASNTGIIICTSPGCTNATNTVITNANKFYFALNTSAGNAQLINQANALLTFQNSSSAGTAAISNTGTLYFKDQSQANASSINNSGGTLNITAMSSPLSMGSVFDTFNLPGSINLGNNHLSIGANDANNTIYGAISGSAGSGLNKLGTATLFLNGNNAGYSGDTHVASGTLAASGTALGTGPVSVDSAAILDLVSAIAGTTTVNSDATLKGSGTLASLSSEGNIAPGETGSLGVITVNGNLSSATGFNYQAKIDGVGNSDLLAINGNVDLSNSTLALSLLNSSYAINTPYTLLTAGTLNGQFTNFTLPNTLSGTLQYNYSQGKVIYEIFGLSDDLLADASTPNQTNVANYLLAMDPLLLPPCVIGRIGGLNNPEQIAAYLDQLSGASYADQESALANAGEIFDAHMRSRIQKRPSTQQLTPWLAAQNTSQTLNSPIVGDFKNDLNTLMYGVETSDPQALFGLGFAYNHFQGYSFKSHEHSNAKGELYQVGGYGSQGVGGWLLGETLNFGYLDHMNTNRWIQTDTATHGNAQARYHASLISAQAQANYAGLKLNHGVQLEPLIGMHGEWLERSDFLEHGNTGVELQLNQDHYDSLRTELGLFAAVPLVSKLRLFAEGLWEHELMDTDSEFDAHLPLAPEQQFHIKGVKIGREVCTTKTGLALAPDAHWSGLVFYESQFASHLHKNAAKLQLEYGF